MITAVMTDRWDAGTGTIARVEPWACRRDGRLVLHRSLKRRPRPHHTTNLFEPTSRLQSYTSLIEPSRDIPTTPELGRWTRPDHRRGGLQTTLWEDDLCPRLFGRNCQYLGGTVGNDSTFYGPPTANQLRWYPNQIPEGFEMCCKVWEGVADPDLCPASLRVKAGQPESSVPGYADVFRQGRYTPRHRCW